MVELCLHFPYMALNYIIKYKDNFIFYLYLIFFCLVCRGIYKTFTKGSVKIVHFETVPWANAIEKYYIIVNICISVTGFCKYRKLGPNV
jgi:hypothetical protein